MVANSSVANLKPVPKSVANRIANCKRKPASWLQRIEACLDKAFEMSFGADEKTIVNPLRGL